MVAQEYRATILGQVVDSCQSAIPRATVKAIKPDTNFSKETVTNEQGIYTVEYEITDAVGLKRTTYKTDEVQVRSQIA